MENKKLRSWGLPGLQFLIIAIVLFTTKRVENLLVALSLITVAIALAVWSVYTMSRSRLRISPVPAEDAVLITTGPYGYIRHPMYAAILTGVAGLLVLDFSLVRLLLAAILFLVLYIKLNWEESLLARKFPGYKAYKLKTRKLVPFLF